MKQKAKNIVKNSVLSEEQKSLWYAVIAANDESFAAQFVETIGEDNETLSIATQLLQTRKDVGTTLEPGFISPAEERYLQQVMDSTPTN